MAKKSVVLSVVLCLVVSVWCNPVAYNSNEMTASDENGVNTNPPTRSIDAADTAVEVATETRSETETQNETETQPDDIALTARRRNPKPHHSTKPRDRTMYRTYDSAAVKENTKSATMNSVRDINSKISEPEEIVAFRKVAQILMILGEQLGRNVTECTKKSTPHYVVRPKFFPPELLQMLCWNHRHEDRETPRGVTPRGTRVQ